MGFLVSKETVVLCQWERSKQKFGFIKTTTKSYCPHKISFYSNNEEG